MAFVEAAAVGVDLVDVDMHFGSAAFTNLLDRGCQQRRADTLAAQAGLDVEFLELGQGSFVVRGGPQCQERETGWGGRGPGEEDKHVIADQEEPESGGKFLGAWAGCFKLGVEVVQETPDHARLAG